MKTLNVVLPLLGVAGGVSLANQGRDHGSQPIEYIGYAGVVLNLYVMYKLWLK